APDVVVEVAAEEEALGGAHPRLVDPQARSPGSSTGRQVVGRPARAHRLAVAQHYGAGAHLQRATATRVRVLFEQAILEPDRPLAHARTRGEVEGVRVAEAQSRNARGAWTRDRDVRVGI